MEELNSGPPKTNPSSGREEDLNPGPPDYKSSALTTRPRCLHLSLSCKKRALKYICDLFEIKHTELFYSCIFDVHCTIISDTGVSFFTSNLIRVEFKFN